MLRGATFFSSASAQPSRPLFSLPPPPFVAPLSLSLSLSSFCARRSRPREGRAARSGKDAPFFLFPVDPPAQCPPRPPPPPAPSSCTCPPSATWPPRCGSWWSTPKVGGGGESGVWGGVFGVGRCGSPACGAGAGSLAPGRPGSRLPLDRWRYLDPSGPGRGDLAAPRPGGGGHNRDRPTRRPTFPLSSPAQPPSAPAPTPPSSTASPPPSRRPPTTTSWRWPSKRQEKMEEGKT